MFLSLPYIFTAVKQMLRVTVRLCGMKRTMSLYYTRSPAAGCAVPCGRSIVQVTCT
jgi:hypothetical protein